MTYAEAVRDFRRQYLLDALDQAGGNQCIAADLIGVHRNTINRLLREVGLSSADIKHLLQVRSLPRKKPVARETEARSPHARRNATAA